MEIEHREHYGVELIGPMQASASWQSKDPEAYDLNRFQIDWEAQFATCPQGKRSTMWSETKDAYGNPIIVAKFSRPDCRQCQARQYCTRSATEARELSLKPRAVHEALQAARQQQQTDEWKELYHRRAGIEGTIAQAITVTGMRRSRYIGLAKTRLQNVLISVALNIARITAWRMGVPHAQTRVSRFAALATDCY